MFAECGVVQIAVILGKITRNRLRKLHPIQYSGSPQWQAFMGGGMNLV
jgi:hypothetical protein